MLNIEKGLYVVIEQVGAAEPPPLQQGFSTAVAYRVLGLYSPPDSNECWLIMANDADEIHYVNQRDVRVHRLLPEQTALRLPLARSRRPLLRAASPRRAVVNGAVQTQTPLRGPDLTTRTNPARRPQADWRQMR